MRRLKLTGRVQLPDGTVAVIKDGLADGRLVQTPVWFHQFNETNSDIVELAPEWRTSAYLSDTIERGIGAVRNHERAATWNRGGMRLLRRLMIGLPNNGGDYGHTSQKAIEGDEALTREVLAHGTLSDEDRTDLETLIRKVDYCAKHIASRRSATRTFEGYMEDWDTDAIVVALLRRVAEQANTQLAREFTGRFRQSALAVAPLYKDAPTYRLRKRAWELKLERDARIHDERERAERERAERAPAETEAA